MPLAKSFVIYQRCLLYPKSTALYAVITNDCPLMRYDQIGIGADRVSFVGTEAPFVRYPGAPILMGQFERLLFGSHSLTRSPTRLNPIPNINKSDGIEVVESVTIPPSSGSRAANLAHLGSKSDSAGFTVHPDYTNNGLFYRAHSERL